MIRIQLIVWSVALAFASTVGAQTNPTLSISVSNGSPLITIDGTHGTVCQLQSAVQLNPTSGWQPCSNLTLSALPSLYPLNSNLTAPAQFYRAQVLAPSTNFQATWASVNRHSPAPEWFKDAKFGIYFHWGVFSVPAFGDEWYPRRMYNTSDTCYTHHVATFGSPSAWPYNNFITGAADKAGNWTQFAPKLASQGGKFDPNAWADLFVTAGARYAGPVAEHHDGFSMWNSTVNEWNSAAKGPKLDLALQFATAIRSRGLKFLMTFHHAFNYNGYYQYVPAQSDPSLRKLYGQLGATAEDQLWYDKLREAVDNYQPDLIYNDAKSANVQEAQRLKFLSYYYNRALDWNREVAVTYKDGFNSNGELYDYERGGPADLQTNYWQADDSVSSSTWCYTTGMTYYDAKPVLHSLIDRVSKNGNMLLNIAPMADGTIPQAQKNILNAMGQWLGACGESVYATRAWEVFGEGPTLMGGNLYANPVAGLAQDIRFTRNKDGNALYAITLGWPGNGAALKIATLNSTRIDLATLTNVSLIVSTNTYIDLPFSQDPSGLVITMPATQPAITLACAFKLSFTGKIPPLSTWLAPTFFQDHNFNNTPVSLQLGSYTTAQLQAAGVLDNSVSSIAIPPGFRVTAYDGDNFSGTSWTLTTSINFDGIAADKAISSLVVTLDSNAWFKIVNCANGMVVDGGGAVSSGSTVKQYAWNGSPNLQWQFVDLGGGWFKIINRINGLAVDGANAAQGGSVVEKTWTSATSQQWQPIQIAGGWWKIVNRASGLVFDSGGNVASGSSLKQWSWLLDPNLEWRLVKVN